MSDSVPPAFSVSTLQALQYLYDVARTAAVQAAIHEQARTHVLQLKAELDRLARLDAAEAPKVPPTAADRRKDVVSPEKIQAMFAAPAVETAAPAVAETDSAA